MGVNKQIRKKIETRQRRIREHMKKIREEANSDFPDQELMKHWKHEIEVWQDQIEKLERRLGRDW